MASTEIVWRTDRGDTASVAVQAPDANDPQHLRVVIGTGLTLRLPRIEARLLSAALADAANMPPPARKTIPIHAAPPAAMYHDPDNFLGGTMSPLTQSLIQRINTEHAAQLAAVEESLTRIEEAETLAATLRHHGVTEARAFGFAVGGDSKFSQARIHLNVSAAGCPPDILTQALRAAELRVSHIQHRDSDGHDYLHLVGIDCPIFAKAAACADAAIQLSEVPA